MAGFVYPIFLLLLSFLLGSMGLSATEALVIVPRHDAYDLNPYLSQIRIAGEQGLTLKPLAGRLDLSQSRGMHWLSFSVDNRSDKAGEFAISSDFPLKTMVLVPRNSPGRAVRSGASVYLREKIPALSQVVTTSLPPGVSSFYLGVDVDGNPFLSAFKLQSVSQFMATDRGSFLMFIFLTGGVLALSLYNVMNYFSLRKVQFLHYSLIMGSYLCLEAVISGFPLMLDPPYSYWLGNSWIIWDSICMIGLTLFASEFFSTKTKYPRHFKVGRGFIVLSFLPFICFPFNLPEVAAFYIVIQSFMFLDFLLIAYVEHTKKNSSARTYLLAFVPAFFLLIAFLWQLLNVVNTSIPFNKIRFVAVAFWGISFHVGYFALIDKIRAAHATLRSSLTGLMPEQQIEKLIVEGKQFTEAPVTKNMTVMFIDIVGYSKTIKSLPPETGFRRLKAILNEVTAVIHKHNGMIDRSLGDGIISFFGYDLAETPLMNHAYQALLAASEIQEKSVAKIIGAGEQTTEPIFPLRIGIQSGQICVGNLGDESRFEISLAGDAVILARKFEAACEPHKIIFGQNTFNALPKAWQEGASVYQRYIAVNPSSDLALCHECDPFHDRRSLLAKAGVIFWQRLGNFSREARIALGDGTVCFTSAYGNMEVINFSLDGFCFKSPMYLGRGTVFELTLPPLFRRDKLSSINSLRVEVVWGGIEGKNRYLLGVKISSLNLSQKALLLDALQSGCDAAPALV